MRAPKDEKEGRDVRRLAASSRQLPVVVLGLVATETALAAVFSAFAILALSAAHAPTSGACGDPHGYVPAALPGSTKNVGMSLCEEEEGELR